MGFHNNIALTVSYSRAGHSGSLESIIFRALSDIIDRVPALCATPMDQDKPTAYFARLLNIDLRRAVEFVDMKQANGCGQQLQDFLNVQHSVSFNNTSRSPFWRLVIFRNPEETSWFVASFVFHHSIGDGMSGMAFHRNFHAALLKCDGSAESNAVQDILMTSPDTIMDPSLEELHPLPLSAWLIGSKLWNLAFGSKNAGFWSGTPISFAKAARKTHVLLTSIAAEKVKVLLSQSREHSVTLTAALETILAESLFDNLSNDYTNLTTSVTVSLRRFIPEINDDSFGNFASSNDHNYSRKDSSSQEAFWEEARRVKVLLDTELAKKGSDSSVGLLRWAGPLPEFFKKTEHKPRGSSLEVGNLGLFKYQQIPGPSEWEIGQTIFSQSHSAFGAPLSASIATGPDGSMAICFAWLETTLETQWVEKVISSFKERMDEIVNV
jgi:hypothetical protein